MLWLQYKILWGGVGSPAPSIEKDYEYAKHLGWGMPTSVLKWLLMKFRNNHALMPSWSKRMG